MRISDTLKFRQAVANMELGQRGLQLIQDGVRLIINHANTRIPMPKSTHEFLDRCDSFSKKYNSQLSN